MSYFNSLLVDNGDVGIYTQILILRPPYNRACPTSLRWTRTSTSLVMSDPSSFWPITALLGIEGTCSQSCIPSLVLSASDTCGEIFAIDDTVCAGDTILQNKRHNQTWYKNWSESATHGSRETLTCFARESWTWRCLQITLKPSESMISWLRLPSMNPTWHLQPNSILCTCYFFCHHHFRFRRLQLPPHHLPLAGPKFLSRCRSFRPLGLLPQLIFLLCDYSSLSLEVTRCLY